MNTSNKKTGFSLEIFPPKPTSDEKTIYQTLDQLKDLEPDFISVTYGTARKDGGRKTIELASDVQNRYHIESVAHLPCISLSRADVLNTLHALHEKNVHNILALRGDISEEVTPCDDFHHANELIRFIKENGDFTVFAACYPEGHIESPDLLSDMQNLKRKVDDGADRLITQLFLDNSYFYAFMERLALCGIHVPVEAGIMPVTNKKQIERMVSLCGIHLPEKFMKMINRYENNPAALQDAGIAYAIDQIVDLISQGVDGIHLYTMNKPYVARRIYEAVRTLLAG